MNSFWLLINLLSNDGQIDTFFISCHISEAVKQAAISEREFVGEP